MNTIFKDILIKREYREKLLAVLLDPEKCYGSLLASTIAKLKVDTPDYIFVGGSHVPNRVDALIEVLKEELGIPVVSFPGNSSQFSPSADAILLLALISGRNPEYLISQHVNAAIAIKRSYVEVIPTAYILIEGGKTSSVEYISNTKPIPRDKKEIALATAVAGELLGMKLVYLEAGSGADLPVPSDIITQLKYELSAPIIVGGGIKTDEQLKEAYDSGADLVVIGNAFELSPDVISGFVSIANSYKREVRPEEEMNQEELY